MRNALFALLFLFAMKGYSQKTLSNEKIIEDEKGRVITNTEEKNFFVTKIKNKKVFEKSQLLNTTTQQTPVELCTNGGFEQHETISGAQKLKNFLYTIGDPPGPTQCQSISNTADAYIDIYNPNNTNVMATSVPANIIDPFIGNINAFDQYALKINYAESYTYGSIVQGKRFKTNNENTLKFNYKAVLMTVYESGHTDNQPFVKARIINAAGTVVSEFCLVGDETNCIFTKIPGSDAAILYTANWQSGLLDISSIPNNEAFTVELMASRCGFGGHFGYMYVDDICLLHSNENFQGSIELNPVNEVCPTLPINVCGSYTIPNSGGITATLNTLTLNLYNETGTSIYSTNVPTTLNTSTHQFCFTLNAANFPNSINANYNVGVTATYNTQGAAGCGGTVFNSASDPDANAGWDISFQNCSPSCNFNVNTTTLSLCDSNHNGSEVFNLTNANANIVTSTTGLSFSYFLTYSDANSNTNPISNTTAYTSTSNTLYVRVAQDASCFKIIAIALEVRNPNVNISGILNVCSGSTVLTATSGASYLWNTGATTQSISPTTTGTYSVTVTDASGCSNSATVTIEPTQTATTPNVIITHPSCFTTTGSIQITSVAAQYSFDNGATWTTNATLNNLNPGTYHVKIKTINNCISYPLEVVINQVFTSYPDYTYTNPMFCGDVGSITITTPASFYSFDNGVTWTTNPTATNLPPGNYFIRTKDAQGCISNLNNVLLSSMTLEAPQYTIINPACGVGGSITINTVSDLYTFDGGTTWVTSNIKTNVTSGNYSIAIKNSLGCTSEFSFAYINDLQNTYPNVIAVQPICGAGGSIAITTIADFYSFDNGVTWTTNHIATNLAPGDYIIKLKNAAGCISQTNFVGLYPPYLDNPILQITQPQCGVNGSVTVNTLSDFYSFDGGLTWVTNNFMSLPVGNYNIKIKNNLGCVSNDNYAYLFEPTIPIPLYTIVQPNCSTTGSITFNTVSSFYSIDGGTTWSNNPVFNNLAGGNYSVIIKNNLGCKSVNQNVDLNTTYLAEPTYTYINPYCGNIGNITFTSVAAFYSIDNGSTWSTNPVFSNLTSGSYYLLVKNNAGCISQPKYVHLSTYQLADPSLTIVQPCNGANGSITFTTTAAFYSIDNGTTWSANPVFSNLGSGDYYLKIKNTLGCESGYQYIYLNYTLPNPSYTAIQPVCGTNGSITITTSAAFYSIDGGNTWSTNPVFSNLAPGYYYVTIKNIAGCSSFSQYAILQQPYISNPSYTITQPTCGVGGIITITSTANQYSIDNGTTWQFSPIFSNLNSNNYYTIVVKNSQGCISQGINVSTEPFYLPNPNITIVQPTCGNNGSISVATLASQYSFDGGNTWTTNPILNNLTSGNYNVIIKNSQGCTSNPYAVYVYIHEYYLPNPLVTITQPTCSVTGNITILTASDFYSFDNGTTWVTNPVLANPTPGSYYVKIKNNLGCVSGSQYVYISTYNLPPPSATITQPTCSTPTGSITINTPADQYSFDNGLTWTSNSTATNLASGSYYIKIKNSLGCESEGIYNYVNSAPNIPNAPAVTFVQPSTCGTTDGSITVVTSALEYSFNNGVTWTTSPSKVNLGAGTYYIKMRNNTNQCESLAAIVNLNSGTTIAAPDFTVVNSGCSNQNGSITITTAAAFYSFDNGISFVSSNTKTNLTPGIYTIKIKNAAGCISASSTATINSSTNLPAPTYSVLQPDCTVATGSITINTISDLYSFDNGTTFSTSNSLSGLSSGNYNIKIKDSNGCISNATTITINNAPNIPNQPIVTVAHPVNCNSQTGVLTVVSTGVSFSFDNGNTWSNSAISNPLAPGNYAVLIKTVANGCASLPTNVTINTPPDIPLLPTVVVTQPTSCVNPFGSISITSAAFQYSFDNGVTYSNNSISGPLAIGTYQVRVKNNFNCQSDAVLVTINQIIDTPSIPVFSIIQPDCNNPNGSITILTNANEYSFDNGISWTSSNTLTNLIPSSYSLKIKNNLGCISNPSIATINTYINNIPLPASTSPQIFCIQQNASLNNIAMTGQNIKWYDALTSGNLLPNTTLLQNAITYYASQTISGCESNRVPVLITIQNTAAPTGNSNQSFCSTENATLNSVAITGNNIIWYSSSTGTTVLSNSTLLQNGVTYYASQTINGCESTARVAISIQLISTLNATNYAESMCDDLNDGFETVNLSNYNSFLTSATGNVFKYYNSLIGAQNQIPSNEISNTSNYNLSIGDNLFYIRIESPNTCFQIVTLNLTLIKKPFVTINDILPICKGSAITINAGIGFDNYLWSTNETTPSIIVTQPGTFSVTVSENHGAVTCSTTKNFTVVNPNIGTTFEIMTSDWTQNENTITVLVSSNSVENYEYSLNGFDFQVGNTFYGLENGEYTVYIRDKNGCVIGSEEVYLLMYPKYFTPNSDGFNDYWRIKFSENEPNLVVTIFDRYGKLITQFGGNSIGWDGNYNGVQQFSSDYWFVVKRENGKEYKGHFTLKR
ncbi:T9SS type B sorting domain-containing protein [Flavobacterium branchiophilum]|uniref:Gliding motility-associated-like protein n=1 Tax=Flavobacterium branchiophilum TaxID=55197 RepID=A0A2H3KDG5_9FLAO|nr:T9SS type B sorting domain-containing protein [Flavobacterium branchiophilum]PDS25794.1 hypothetical protein B0A77_03935 [Flavobacterium branchiophilum]